LRAWKTITLRPSARCFLIRGAAAIALRSLRHLTGTEPILIPQDYGWPLPPVETFDSEDCIYILDFSFPPAYMHALSERCRVWWIDHHTPRIDECRDAGVIEQCAATSLSDHQPSASLLTWRFFHHFEAPAIVDCIDAWDSYPDPKRDGRLWDATVRPVQFGLRSRVLSPESPEWDRLLFPGDTATEMMQISALRGAGAAILRYLDLTSRQAITTQAYLLQIHAPMIHVGDVIPPGAAVPLQPVLALLWNRHPMDPKELMAHPSCSAAAPLLPSLLITWAFDSSVWRLSLSPGPAAPTLDCGRIAQALWRGGGHPGRAGATFPHLPPALLPYTFDGRLPGASTN
jgi:hypothetical protein